MEMERSSPPKLLLAFMLLLLAPLREARKLGGPYDGHLRLPSDGAEAPPQLIVNELPGRPGGYIPPPPPKPNDGRHTVQAEPRGGGVSKRREEVTPPPPKRNDGEPQPGHKPRGGVSNRPKVTPPSPDPNQGRQPGVSNRPKLPPPSPKGSPPTHYRRSSPTPHVLDVINVLHVFRDAVVRYVIGV